MILIFSDKICCTPFMVFALILYDCFEYLPPSGFFFALVTKATCWVTSVTYIRYVSYDVYVSALLCAATLMFCQVPRKMCCFSMAVLRWWLIFMLLLNDKSGFFSTCWKWSKRSHVTLFLTSSLPHRTRTSLHLLHFSFPQVLPGFICSEAKEKCFILNVAMFALGKV